jgi:hypothetical protein
MGTDGFSLSTAVAIKRDDLKSRAISSHSSHDAFAFGATIFG